MVAVGSSSGLDLENSEELENPAPSPENSREVYGNTFSGEGNPNMGHITNSLSVASEAVTETYYTNFRAAGFDIDGGGVVVTVKNEINAEVGGDVEIQLPIFTGFASTITPEDDNLFTKAVTDGQIWLASAEKVLNMKYGMKPAGTKKYILKGVLGQSISSYVVRIFYQVRTLSFSRVEGTVMWQDVVMAEPIYESHDSHDSHDTHDAHDGHGNSNPAAGGGGTAGE